MAAAQRFFRLANEPGATGLSCNENGVHLGCAPLLRRTDAGFEPRPSYEIEALIAKAYRGAEDGARLSSGLRCIADCLNKGELAPTIANTVANLQMSPTTTNFTMKLSRRSLNSQRSTARVS